MNCICLQLDDKAKDLVKELLLRIEDADIQDVNSEEQDDWITMTPRYAAQIDAQLIESQYIGTVGWFSESDFIEKKIEYK
ncbi:hypothetical protein ACP43V_09875 [Vibrio genomosp. F10 str. 9ZC157]|uniref:Uncharacterized protein n=1 Tax=Vibrio genomosp. F10 str. ZF-129 TaxID=1187848 RepID=A0A1E5BHS9_9VIBR|nr:hypothetical protein [Vibrio genomosp. F10]OEE35829.1 hypothetical protein A1QO_19735 [Vibrio genomosp. F10 str. ZF-129]OEE95355.1 hypothetical protein A1QM_18030 [Vibrio genomosp. F10 str. 9ZC157]OEF06014.1 hypothetical protein A1QK_08760 [Vibrio genomosp. F10 str. 9ZD137]